MNSSRVRFFSSLIVLIFSLGFGFRVAAQTSSFTLNGFAFGWTNVGTTYSGTITVQNTGAASLSIASVSVEDPLDFRVAPTLKFPVSVLPSDAFLIPIEFTPTGPGHYFGGFAVKTVDGDSQYIEVTATTLPAEGVSENSHKHLNATIFPNPTTGLVTIHGATGTVSLEDAVGRTVTGENRIENNGETSLDLSNQPAGIYFVLIGNDGQITVEKVIKE